MLTRVLIDSGVHPTQAKIFAEPLLATLKRFDIKTRNQRAAFLAQCMHESAMLKATEESLWYRTPERIVGAFSRLAKLAPLELHELCRNPTGLANMAYAGINGNGGVMSGDGWRYRGSGLIQLTGLGNFKRAQADTGRPYVEHPELVRQNPDDATLTAGLFWHWNDCNRIIDEDDFMGVSRMINLGTRKTSRIPNGAQIRRDLYDEVFEAMHEADQALLTA